MFLILFMIFDILCHYASFMLVMLVFSALVLIYI